MAKFLGPFITRGTQLLVSVAGAMALFVITLVTAQTDRNWDKTRPLPGAGARENYGRPRTRKRISRANSPHSF